MQVGGVGVIHCPSDARGGRASRKKYVMMIVFGHYLLCVVVEVTQPLQTSFY